MALFRHSPPRPTRIAFLCQEADRPGRVMEAIGDLPPEVADQIVVTGWTVADASSQPEALAADLGACDLCVLSHILVEDVAESVAQLIDESVPADAHVLVLNSLLPLLSKTRLGKFRFADKDGQPAKATLEKLKKFLPAGQNLSGGGDLSDTFRGLVQQAPDILRRMPPFLVDIKAWLRAFAFWAAPSHANLRSMVVMLADLYGAKRGRLKKHWQEPVVYPLTALWHPSCGMTECIDDLPKPSQGSTLRGTVGLLLMRGAVLGGATKAACSMIKKLESQGYRVMPAFAESFDFRSAIEKFFDPVGIDALISMTGFPLVGGHNRSDPEGVSTFLKHRDIPYFTPAALMVQDEQAWERSGLGLSPMEVAMQTAIHELEGGIEPLPIHTMAGSGGDAAKSLIDERADRFIERLNGWRELQRVPNHSKRILLTLFSFPPGKGSVGTAAYLDVFRSAHAVLQRLKDEGYTVSVPETADDLLHAVVEGEDPRAPISSAGIAVGARMTVAEYESLAPQSKRVERMWGPAPGALCTDGRDLLIHGIQLGNVFVGVQPSFGFEGDPMRLLFDRGATPHHGFLAYYTWAEKVFAAHATLHLGTHGALEFMPGKQVGMSARCWPDILAGSKPNLYLYAVNNPSEGTIAKRRGSALTIGHLTPPAGEAGLAKELSTLQGLVAEYRSTEDESRRSHIAASLIELAEDSHVTESELPLPDQPNDPAAIQGWVSDLTVVLAEVAARRIPIGLHTIGRTPREVEVDELLVAYASAVETRVDQWTLSSLLLLGLGHDPKVVEVDAREGQEAAVLLLEELRNRVRHLVVELRGSTPSQLCASLCENHVGLAPHRPQLEACLEDLSRLSSRAAAGDELTPLVNALSGRYVPPGPGGDPVRHPGTLPTGRNLHALDPAAVPSPAAWRQAEEAVARLLERHERDHGTLPTSLGLVLWGLDNIKTHGEGIAQAFHLIGARPVRNSIGRMERIEIIPLRDLGRPRIDVTVTASGIFRDIFGLQMALLDKAMRQVMDLDEPLELNTLRARALGLEAKGFDPKAARSRIFSNAPGAYGTYIDTMVNLGRWDERSDLADSFQRRKSFVFGHDQEGESQPELLSALAEELDGTVQNLDSAEVSLTDVDHYFEYLGGLTALSEARSGKRPPAHVLDATSGRLRVRSLEETVRLESRARLLNPRWYEGLMEHGYEGVEEIRKRLEYTFGWSATAEAVDEWVYSDALHTFVGNEDLGARMQAANPHAYSGLVERLAEAADRGFWSPTEADQDMLDTARDGVEDLIEGIA